MVYIRVFNKVHKKVGFLDLLKTRRIIDSVFCISVVMLILLVAASIIPISFKDSETLATIGNETSSSLDFVSIRSIASVYLDVNDKDGTFATSNENQKAAFTISTNNYTGYTLKIKLNGANTNLSNGEANIPTLLEPATSATFSSSGASGQALNNRWGYIPNYYNSTVNSDYYYPSPSSAGTILNATTSASSDNYTIGLGLRTDYSKPTGTYSNDAFILEFVANPIAYNISFNDNTGDSTVAGLPSTLYNATSLTSITLPNSIPTRTGYSFNKWCLGTVSNNGTTCSGTEFAQGDYFGIDQTVDNTNIKLFATWIRTAYDVTITVGKGITSLTASDWSGSGTSTITKTLNYGETINLATIVPTYKTGYTGSTYTKNDSVGTLNGSTYTVGLGNGSINIKAASLNTPVCKIAGGTTKVYNYSATMLTATANDSNFDTNSINITYSFGYSSSSTGTLGNFGAAQTGNTISIGAAAYRGTRYYGVRVVVTDKNDSTLTNTCTSGTGSGTGNTASNRTTLALVNSRIDFNANGGTMSSSSPAYVSYQGAYNAIYSSRTGTSSGAVPTVTPPTGYVFDGWYTASSGGAKVINADGTLTGTNVSGWTNADGKWVKTGTSDSTGVSANQLYAQFQRIYMQDMVLSDCQKSVGVNGNSSNIGSNITIKDKRNEYEYTVRYINGNCWMTKNLRITGTVSATYSNFTGSSINVTQYSLSSSDSSYSGHCDDTNGLNYPCGNNSNSTDIGVYYNYYSATAGSIHGGAISSDATVDICPAGWHLPTGPSTTVGTELNKIVGNTTAGWQSATTGLNAFGAVGTGYYVGGSLIGPTYSNWWSSSVYNSKSSHRMIFNSNGNQFYGNSNNTMTDGRSIRCVLK